MSIRITAVFCFAILLTACGPSEEEVAIAKAQERVGVVVSVVRQHFGNSVKAGNWGTWPVTSVNGRVSDFSPYEVIVYIEMAVPPTTAKDIMAMSTQLQYKAVGWNACPSRRDSIWLSLEPDDRIVARPTISGAVFADVDCRREGL